MERLYRIRLAPKRPGISSNKLSLLLNTLSALLDKKARISFNKPSIK